MLSMDPIARVILNLPGSSSSSASVFDTGLIMAEVPSGVTFSEELRLLSFSSAEEARAGLLEIGYTAASNAVKAALKYFGASPAPSSLLFSVHPSSETPAEALAAVLDLTAAFYGVMVADSLDASAVLALDEAIRGASHPMVLFVPVTGTPSAVVVSTGILTKLYEASSRRALPVYVDAVPDTAAVMSTAMGLLTAHPTDAFSLCYKTVAGISPMDLTETQVTAVKALNGNVYIRRGYTHTLLENGSVSSGARYDEVLYLDLIADELRSAAISLLAERSEKLPQTDDTSAMFMNQFSGILSTWAGRGVLATSVWRGAAAGPLNPGDVLENGFALWAESYDLQTDADRAAHKAMPIQVALTLAGSVESLVIAINVSL